MHFLDQIRKFNLPQELLIQFYTAIIQAVLCACIAFCFGSATKQNRNRLQGQSEIKVLCQEKNKSWSSIFRHNTEKITTRERPVTAASAKPQVWYKSMAL
ncbi:unnamed protein product [Pleuronectes platessa]|uniref:Alkylated DNA repair protein AlkB homologue 8 N-terminal domain-containing protein n=1 Tax=Pleuronectes platessa TaxID=8262 RepID=A0A9N7URP1_PLEPL|nr:unnamed protein product [Pleuronectes platessa]